MTFTMSFFHGLKIFSVIGHNNYVTKNGECLEYLSVKSGVRKQWSLTHYDLFYIKRPTIDCKSSN